MFVRLVLASPLLVMAFLAFIDAQTDITSLSESFNSTELELTCSIGNKTYTGDECLEGLGKFGRIVSYIVLIFVFIIVCCCCCCWCCVCKIIHGKRGNSEAGQVLSRPQPVITTVA